MKALLRWTGYAILLSLILLVAVQFWFLAHIWYWADHNPESTAFMRSRLEIIREDEPGARLSHRWVPYNRISGHLKRAVVAAEDDKFMDHTGFDWEAIQKAYEKNLREGEIVSGASTIPQQLSKNLFFTTYKSLVRKAREAIVVSWMEHDLPKKRIIEIYLNVIEWGDGVYGCEAAARRYYGVSCASLDVDQAAGLAAMIPSPRRINPRINPSLHARATSKVLRQMRWAGYLRRDIRDMGNEPDKIVPDETGPEPHDEDDSPTPSPLPSPTPEGNQAPSAL